MSQLQNQLQIQLKKQLEESKYTTKVTEELNESIYHVQVLELMNINGVTTSNLIRLLANLDVRQKAQFRLCDALESDDLENDARNNLIKNGEKVK